MFSGSVEAFYSSHIMRVSSAAMSLVNCSDPKVPNALDEVLRLSPKVPERQEPYLSRYLHFKRYESYNLVISLGFKRRRPMVYMTLGKIHLPFKG